MLRTRKPIPVDEIPFGEEHLYAAVDVSHCSYEAIPENLDVIPPGPVLAGWLSSIDVALVSAYDRIVVLKAHRRLASHYQAQMYRDMVAVADAEADHLADSVPLHLTDEAASAEVGTALRLTRRSADTEMAFALELYRRLPRLAQLLESGTIDVARAKVIERASGHLSDAGAQGVVDQIADVAGDLTTGELRARLRRICVQIDPDDTRDRYTAAVAQRRVFAEANESGTAGLFGYDLPPDRVQEITRRIDTIARSLRRHDESRTMDQLRADIYLDLLNGSNHHGVGRGVVDIWVDLATLAGLDDQPGELGGYGPIIADIARRIAEDHLDAEWRVTVTDPETGEPVAFGTTRRRPTAAQRRRIETRDRVCVFPGCRMPATTSDLDHTRAVQDGGPTTDDNLAPLCRHHHRIKHEHGWVYRKPPVGPYQWISPVGQVYIKTRPPP